MFSLVGLATCSLLASSAAPPGIFVSPAGNDSAQGTFDQPLLTLPAAAQRSAGGTVWLRGNAGPFRVHNTTSALQLTASHNGTAFTCYDPECVVSGSVGLLALQQWTKSVDKRLPDAAIGHVLELDLSSVVPEALDRLGTVSNTGDHATLRLGDKPLQLARWPNLDPAHELTPHWARNAMKSAPPIQCKVPSTGYESCIVVDGDVAMRAKRWADAAARGELALSGFWRYFWRDDVVPAVTVKPYNVNGTEAMLLSRSDGHAIGTYGAPPNASYFFALNVLEELDVPGEYFIDRAEGKVFLFAPIGSRDEAKPELALLSTPLVSVTGARSITLSGITFEGTRATAATISGGEGVTFDNCSFQHLGHSALTITGGKAHALRRSSIRYLGLRGVELSGGDRTTLTAARHLVVDSTITDYGRWRSTYEPAVHIDGVGHRVERNEMAYAWHQAVGFSGNDHIISANHIHHVVLETYDSAAIYGGRDFTARGIVVSSNLFRAIGRPNSPCQAAFTSCHRHAVYADDHLSGVEVWGNVFDGSEAPPAGDFDGLIGFFANGGRDHNVSNNLFLANTVPAVITGHAPSDGSDCGSVTSTLWQRLAAMPYRSEPWRSRYPKLFSILDEKPCWPLHNMLAINLIVNSSGPPAGLQRYTPNLQKWAHGNANNDPAGLNDTLCFGMGQNLVSSQPGFVSPDPIHAKDFSLRPDSKAWAMGWAAIATTFGPTR